VIDDKSWPVIVSDIVAGTPPNFDSFGTRRHRNSPYIWSICRLMFSNSVSPNPSPIALSAVTLTNMSSVYVITDTDTPIVLCDGNTEYIVFSGDPLMMIRDRGPDIQLNCKYACGARATNANERPCARTALA